MSSTMLSKPCRLTTNANATKWQRRPDSLPWRHTTRLHKSHHATPTHFDLCTRFFSTSSARHRPLDTTLRGRASTWPRKLTCRAVQRTRFASTCKRLGLSGTATKSASPLEPTDSITNPRHPSTRDTVTRQKTLRDYLDFKFQNPPFFLLTWKQLLEPDLSLPLELRDDPLSILRSETEDLVMVGRCLEHWIALNQSSAKDKLREQQQYAEVKPGARTLAWLLHDNKYDRCDLALAPQFVRSLTFCLAAEREEESVWMWLKIKHTPRYAVSWLPRQQVMWRGVVLKHFVIAASYWHDSHGRGLEHALSLYHHVLGWRTHQHIHHVLGRRTHQHIPIAPLGVWLIRMLSDLACPAMDEEKIRNFADTLCMWRSDQDETDWTRARLFLNLRFPDPTEALDFLRKSQRTKRSSPFVRGLLNPCERQTERLLFRFIVRTAHVLRDQDRLDEAMWTLEYGHRCAPRLFSFQGSAPDYATLSTSLS